MKKIFRTFIFAGFCLVTIRGAIAWVTNINEYLNWNQLQGTPKQVIYTINPNCTSDPPSHEEQISAIEAALATWTADCSNLYLEHIGSNTNTHEIRNGNNEICWKGGGPLLAFAQTYRWWTFDDEGYHLVETDITLYNSWRWSVSNPCPPNAVDIQTVVLHESGHAIGLEHETVESSVMYNELALGQIRRNLYWYDICGVRTIYSLYAVTPSPYWVAQHNVIYQWTTLPGADSDYIGHVTVQLNRSWPNPDMWETIACNLPNTGSLSRWLDGNVSNCAAFRVFSDAHPKTYDMTDQTFSIIGYCIYNPSPDVTWFIGQLRDIQWVESGVSGAVNLYLVPQSGGEPTTIASNVNGLDYLWLVNAPYYEGQYTIKSRM
jgi:hypothetical protein